MNAKELAAHYRAQAKQSRATADKLERMAEDLEDDALAHLVFADLPTKRKGSRRTADTPKPATKKNRRDSKRRRPTSPRPTTRRGGRPTGTGRKVREGSTAARVAQSVATHPHQSRSERAAALGISATLLSYHLRKQGLASQAD